MASPCYSRKKLFPFLFHIHTHTHKHTHTRTHINTHTHTHAHTRTHTHTHTPHSSTSANWQSLSIAETEEGFLQRPFSHFLEITTFPLLSLSHTHFLSLYHSSSLSLSFFPLLFHSVCVRVSVCVCVFLSMCGCDCVCLSLCVSANFFDYNTDFAIFVSTGFRKWFFYLSVFVSAIWRILVFEDSTRSQIERER